MKNGDILLLSDGRILEVVDAPLADSELSIVQFLDKDENSFIDTDELDVAHNLGQSAAVLFNYHAMHGIHLRLNRLGRV